MKKLFTLLVCIGIAGIAIAQAPCNSPMPELAFRKAMDDLTRTVNERQMENKTRIILRNNCLSAAQVREIASLFFDDFSRLKFTKAAYPKTVDQVNFYDVYDVFAYFSTVFRLHDYVIAFDLQNIPPPVEAAPEPIRPRYPNYDYPDALRYNGPTFCNTPTSDLEFDQLVVNVNMQPSDPSRLTVGTQLAKKYCFTTAQVMKMTSLMGTDKARLNFLIDAHDYVFDPGNYGFCEQTLTPGPVQEQFRVFVASKQAPPAAPAPPPCGVAPEEFSQIVETIKKQSFNNTQITLAKQIIKSKECFTSGQIKDLVNIFSFESSKLDIAKYAYDYCIDKNNYYVVNDAFDFSSSIDELSKYIQSRK